MNIHLISIGGAVMHNLAIALKKQGHAVTGSDDEIYEPAKSRLAEHGLLPRSIGWDASRVTEELDMAIVGMHARSDNPELLKAIEIGLKVYSFPEYIYEHSRNKKRVVIAGSHGKTSTTAMVMHVLRECNLDFDYLVGAQIEGFENMVKLSDAPVIIIEGDEYLTSAIDRRPKFLVYHAHIGLITGIAWDHINVFPTFEGYVDQFRSFVDMLPPDGTLIYFEGDENLVKIADSVNTPLKKIPYNVQPHKVLNGHTHLIKEGKNYPVGIFGDHNLQNLSGARLVCLELGISEEVFFQCISNFTGAAKRLQVLKKTENSVIYRDFAHSPSKLKATVDAVKKQHPDKRVVACYELHTFSSLNKEFLVQYHNTMGNADEAVVYFHEHVFEKKKMPVLSVEEVKEAFGGNIKVFIKASELHDFIKSNEVENTALLLMSSGNFGDLDLASFTGDKD